MGKSCNMFWSVKYDQPFLKLEYTWTFVFCRMRDKGKQKAPPPKQAKPGFNRKERQRRQMEKPTQTRNQVKIYSVFLFISLGRLHKTLCVLRSSFRDLNDIRNYKKISRLISAPKKKPQYRWFSLKEVILCFLGFGISFIVLCCIFVHVPRQNELLSLTENTAALPETPGLESSTYFLNLCASCCNRRYIYIYIYI